MAPNADTLPGVYPLTLRVRNRNIPFYVTILPDDVNIKLFMVVYKTVEEASWLYSIPDETLAEYTVAIPPSGNPLSGILELNSTNIVINDLSNPKLRPGMYRIELILTDLSGNERTTYTTLAIKKPIDDLPQQAALDT